MEKTISFKRDFSLSNPNGVLIIFELDNGEFWSAIWHWNESWRAFKVELNNEKTKVIKHDTDSEIKSDSIANSRTAIWNKVNEKELV